METQAVNTAASAHGGGEGCNGHLEAYDVVSDQIIVFAVR
jgi:hypothetical protein